MVTLHHVVIETDLHHRDTAGTSGSSAGTAEAPVHPWARRVLDGGDLFTPIMTTPGEPSRLPDPPHASSSSSSARARPRALSSTTKATLAARSAAGSRAFVETHTSRDWRYGSVDAGAVDLGPLPLARQSPPPASTDHSILKSAFIGYGIVRLYRDLDDGDEQSVDTDDSTVVAILAAPGYMSTSDLLEFVGPDTRAHMSHMRMVSASATPSRYMVLIKFPQTQHATDFYMTFNGKLFNSMEAESCAVVFVKSVKFRSHARQDSPDIPYLLKDPFTESVTATSRSSHDPSAELPTCPVCLERLDASVTGLLTILCQHTFHCQCLRKWGDGSCPVCRHTQAPAEHLDPPLPVSSQCYVCEAGSNLWACLICGHVGCGRYDQAHAYDHFIATGHCYAMDISTQRVWDYASDGYVHRLIQNESDGKLVELPSEKKKDADEDVRLQYTYLLTSQLESQRDYYEGICTSASDSAKTATLRAERAERELDDLRAKLEQLQTQQTTIPSLEKDLAKANAKNEQLRLLYTKLQNDYKQEKVMSEKMLANLEHVRTDKDAQDKVVADLQEQLRDMMFYLDAQQKLSTAGDDIKEGTVVVGKKGRKKPA